jgi:hypothetical protein
MSRFSAFLIAFILAGLGIGAASEKPDKLQSHCGWRRRAMRLDTCCMQP